MAVGGYSGKDGTAKIGSTDIYELRGWKFNPKSNNPKYASNRTSGYKRTLAGVKEATGSMSGADDRANDFIAVVDVGTSVTLKLYTDATHFFSVPSVIDDYSMNVDIDNGEIVGWDANFSSSGAWTNPTSPMMAPAGAEVPSGSSGGGEIKPEESSNPFNSAQMDVIANTAAQAASLALANFFENLAKTNPAFAPFAAPAAPAAASPPAEAAQISEPVEDKTKP